VRDRARCQLQEPQTFRRNLVDAHGDVHLRQGGVLLSRGNGIQHAVAAAVERLLHLHTKVTNRKIK